MTDARDRDALDELDARWCAVEDAYALGEPAEHTPPPADPRIAGAWEQERAFYAALAREATGNTFGHASGPMPTADDLALVEAVLGRHEAAGEIPLSDDAPIELHRRSSATPWVALALAVAAAVVLAFFALTPELGLRGSEGSWIAEGGQRRSGPGDALPMAVWLVADGPACAALDDTASLCAGEGTVLRVHRGGEDGRASVEVRRGSVTIDGALAVQTAAGELHGDEAARFAVTVSADDGAVEVDVQQGELQLVAPEGTRSLEPGDRVRLGDEPSTLELAPPTSEPTAPPTPAPTPAPEPARPSERSSKSTSNPTTDPAALLVQARARLGEGDERGAAKSYSMLIDGHPSSAEAQAARVSLGQLRLAGGRPKAALALFDRYLQRGGPLTEEALWGKIQALSALGRREELAAAVDRLVHDLPRSVYRARAQALLR